jgi:hypothetical protein
MAQTPNGQSGSISENDDAVRNLKSSESVVAAFHAEGFPSPPGDIAAIITAHVKSSTRDIPLNKIANMTPGSGPLGTSAAAGVNMFLTMLTPAQREAAKAGVNPLDPAAVLKFSMTLNNRASGLEAGLAGNNGGRFSGMRDGLGDRRDMGAALSQQATFLGKMSGTDFASRLGFQGDQAKEFGNVFAGTSGAFRSTAEDYKRVMDDPTASPEQRQAAAERMQRAAKTKKEKEAAEKFQKAVEKMKADGVNLSDSEAQKRYAAEHPDVGKVLEAQERKIDDKKPPSVSTESLDKKAEDKVKIASAGDPSQKKTGPRPATVQSTL